MRHILLQKLEPLVLLIDAQHQMEQKRYMFNIRMFYEMVLEQLQIQLS